MIRLATRGSALARAQTGIVAAALAERGVESEVVVVRTAGDARQDVPVSAMEGQGWFTAELERALVDGRADCAVHSAKDLPTELAPGLRIVATLARADPRDGVVGPPGGLAALPSGARIGTSSARRSALLAELRPDVVAVPMRGNVDTRLRKLDDGEVDALLLACAGLDRLGLGHRIAERLDPAVMVPAPAQGAIALEVVAGAARASAPADLAALDDPSTRIAVRAERAVLSALGGGCLLPLGAFAEADGDRIRIVAALGTEGGVRRAESTAALDAVDGAVAAIVEHLR